MPDPSAADKARMRLQFENLGVEQVRTLMMSGGLVTQHNVTALGGVDTYRIHKMMAARVTTAR